MNEVNPFAGNDSPRFAGGDNPQPSQFEVLLQRLDPDRERAGEKYEEVRRKLIKFFEWSFCFPAEDLVDKTFDKVAQKLHSLEVGDVVGFTWGVAKNIRREAQRMEGRTVGLPDLPAGENSLACAGNPEQEIHEKMEQERQSQCLRQCMKRLQQADREMFLAYHSVQGDPAQSRLRLAQDLGLAHGTMRTRVSRLRDELEKCARKCMASPGS